MLRPHHSPTSHEDLFIERYQWLLRIALRLTNDRALAEDLVHDAFIHFAFSHTDPNSIQNLEGYFYTMLRNLYLLQERRATRSRLQQLSILDYDSVEIGLRVMSSQDQMQVQDDLRQVCHYACARKESSRAASILILRFFHGYYPSEIAQILRTTRRAVDERLRIARAEAKISLQNPKAFSFVGQDNIPEILPTPFARAADDFLTELRAQIFRARGDDCLSKAEVKEIYRPDNNAAMDHGMLAHIVSCTKCLDAVNSQLGLPILAERYPTDTIGKETRPKGGSGGSGGGPTFGGGGGAGGNVKEAVHKYRRRSREIFEHRPKELHFLVNGFVLGSQSVNSELSEQTLDINLTERIGFVEIVSDQEVPLLFVNVDPPPDGPVKQPARAEFSDGRSLDLELSFSSTWPTLHVVYSDPLLASEPMIESDEAPVHNAELQVGASAQADSRKKRLTGIWNRIFGSAASWRLFSKPATVTAIVSVLLIAALLFTLRTRTPNLSASGLLQQSIAAEEILLSRTDQVLHRTISLEERSSSGDLIARRTIEVWQNAAKKVTARRVYDDKGQLIGGEWTRTDGSAVIYHHGSKPEGGAANPTSLLPPIEDIWQLDPSSRVFSSLIPHVEEAAIEERPEAYVLTYQGQGTGAGNQKLLKAILTLSRADLHATELRILVAVEDANSQLKEFRFMESAFERRPPNTVAPGVFEPDPELLANEPAVRRFGEPEDRVANSNANAPAPVVATADLEIEVMRLLSDAKADLGEQITATRTPEGVLKVQGVVDTDKRKREILAALNPVISNPAVKVDIKTVAEAVAESKTQSSSPATMERVEAGSDQFPAYVQLRRHFSEEESRRFADRVVELSRQAMSHAGAMKKLASKFSPEDLRTMAPEAHAKWLAMIRGHAHAFEQESRSLRLELQPIFFPSGGSDQFAEVNVADDPSLIRAVERLFQIGLSNEQTIRSAFSISTDRGAASGINSPQFSRSLREAESLATKISKQ